MKVVFVGPSLPDIVKLPDVEIRPPACQGDVMQAVRDGATAIGLIDGQFEFVAPVWHKELLFALSQNISVFGAASMGALRAAECAAYGMIGVGKIYEDYASGRRDDDGDVALLHGPAELAYLPLTVPMVNVDATLARAEKLGVLAPADCLEISHAARGIFFKDRSWARIAEVVGFDFIVLRNIIKQAWVDQKRLDAVALLEVMQRPIAAPSAKAWTFNEISVWRRLFRANEGEQV
jgi:hypothetical protein